MRVVRPGHRATPVLDGASGAGRRARVRHWLVLAPRGTQPTAAARRAGRLALELVRAGERVTLAGAGLPQGPGWQRIRRCMRDLEIIPPGGDAFTRWIDGRDETVRVLLATSHPSDVEVARLARERGARVVCDATDAAADDGGVERVQRCRCDQRRRDRIDAARGCAQPGTGACGAHRARRRSVGRSADRASPARRRSPWSYSATTTPTSSRAASSRWSPTAGA